MDREQMIDVVVADLESWLDRDRQGFMSHVEDLERAYLKDKPLKELTEIYEESV